MKLLTMPLIRNRIATKADQMKAKNVSPIASKKSKLLNSIPAEGSPGKGLVKRVHFSPKLVTTKIISPFRDNKKALRKVNKPKSLKLSKPKKPNRKPKVVVSQEEESDHNELSSDVSLLEFEIKEGGEEKPIEEPQRKKKKSLQSPESASKPVKKDPEHLQDTENSKTTSNEKQTPSPNKPKKRKSLDKVEGDEKNEEKKPKLCEMKVKERKAVRKQGENRAYEIGRKALMIWEELRKEKCPKERRKELTSNLLNLVQGHMATLIFAHDTVRTIECLMAFANAEQREKIFGELQDKILLLAQSKYAKFFLLKVLMYGTKKQKDTIVSAFNSKVLKLVGHNIGSIVLETAYNDHANAKQRNNLIQEFYGPTFAVFKDEDADTLEKVLEKHPTQKKAILSHVHEVLIKLTNKAVVKHSIIHRILRDYLNVAEPTQRSEMILTWRDHLPHILHTKDGSRAALSCIWHGTTKDRKVIVKSLNKLMTKVAMEENGCLVAMALADCVDDIKLLQMVVINELMSSLTQLVDNHSGRRVLTYLFSPRNSLTFHPDYVALLKPGDSNETTKKPPEVKRKEILDMISRPFLDYVAGNACSLMQSNPKCIFLLSVLRVLDDPVPAYRAISNYLGREPYSAGKIDHPIEHPGCNMLLKKLVIDDKGRHNSQKSTFSETLVEVVASEALQSWVHCNRGCFLLLNLLETKVPIVQERVSAALGKLHKVISQKGTKGSQLLLKELRSKDVKIELLSE